MSPRPWFVVAVACVLALAFLGLRGLWEPDEGRYTNVALMMLDSGDWLSPMRNEATGHWTKPPMTYWMIAGSVAVFGQHAWAARLPIALSFLVCAWCVWGIARVLMPGREAKAALVFATMVAPFGAAQLITTDFPLAAAEAAAMLAYVRSRFGARAHPAWLLGMGAAFGLAFLIKGPPALLPLLAIAVFERLVPMPAPTMRWAWMLGALVLGCVVALPWYVAVILKHEGLLAYFLGAEVIDRIATDRFSRNGEWYGWLKVYVPMLLVGTLPWTRRLWRWMRTWPARVRVWRSADGRSVDSTHLLLILWIVLPLLVFCVSRSRLPLYVLPLFVPLALGIASVRRLRFPRWPWLATWCIALLAFRLGASHWETPKDASAWADAIRERTTAPVHKVVFIDDTVRWGLHLHLDAQVERRTRAEVDEPLYGRVFDGALAGALEGARLANTVFVAPHADWEALQSELPALGHAPQALGDPFDGRVFFLLQPLH